MASEMLLNRKSFQRKITRKGKESGGIKIAIVEKKLDLERREMKEGILGGAFRASLFATSVKTRVNIQKVFVSLSKRVI